MTEPIVIEFAEPKHREYDRKGKLVSESSSEKTRMKTRILRPSEYVRLRHWTNPSYHTLFDLSLLTGMRVVEIRLFLQNPSWFSEGFIHLPTIAIKKQKATVKQRWVHLSIKGRTVVENIQLTHFREIPTEQALIQYLRKCAWKADIGIEGINMKMFRKTYESWLIASYPDRKEEVFLSAGHNDLTALKHYVNLPFLDRDREEMREFVEGWK